MLEQVINDLNQIEEYSTDVKDFYQDAMNYLVKNNYKPIGYGDGRCVYAVDDEYVVKIAYNEYGLEQNDKETELYKKYCNTDKGKNSLADIEYSEEYFIIMERLTKCTEDDLLYECNMSDYKELYDMLFNDGDYEDCAGTLMINWLVNEAGVDPYEIKAKNFGYDEYMNFKMLDYGV